MIRACIAGAGGKMGSRILSAVRAEEDFVVTGAFERPESPQVGLDAGLLSGAGPLKVPIAASIEQALGKGADVVIDFTAPAASLRHAAACAERGVALVVGTTGFSAQAKAELAGHARRIPLLMAPNMSVGVNVLFRLVAEAARALGASYEIEIVEIHLVTERNRLRRNSGEGRCVLFDYRSRSLDPQLPHLLFRGCGGACSHQHQRR